MQVHTTEALDISAQTAVNLKNAMAARSSAVILKNEDANARIALVSVTNARITQNSEPRNEALLLNNHKVAY